MMPTYEIEIRNVTSQDIPALADLHRHAFKESMNSGIGKGYVRRFLAWFLGRPDAIALVARLNGEPCGYAAGMPVELQAQLNHDLLWTAALGSITHPWVFLQKRYRTSALAKIKRIVSLHRGKPAAVSATAAVGRGIGLVSIAVGSQFSGKGIGLALVSEFAKQATALRFDYAELEVRVDNGRARSIYQKAGWEPCAEGGDTVTYRKELAATDQPNNDR